MGGDVNVPRLVPSLLLSCRLPLALNGRSGFVHGTQRSRWYRQLHQATSEPPLRRRKRLKLISCGHLQVQMSGNAPLLSETRVFALCPAVHSPWRRSKVLIVGTDPNMRSPLSDNIHFSKNLTCSVPFEQSTLTRRDRGVAWALARDSMQLCPGPT